MMAGSGTISIRLRTAILILAGAVSAPIIVAWLAWPAKTDHGMTPELAAKAKRAVDEYRHCGLVEDIQLDSRFCVAMVNPIKWWMGMSTTERREAGRILACYHLASGGRGIGIAISSPGGAIDGIYDQPSGRWITGE